MNLHGKTFIGSWSILSWFLYNRFCHFIFLKVSVYTERKNEKALLPSIFDFRCQSLHFPSSTLIALLHDFPNFLLVEYTQAFLVANSPSLCNNLFLFPMKFYVKN